MQRNALHRYVARTVRPTVLIHPLLLWMADNRPALRAGASPLYIGTARQTNHGGRTRNVFHGRIATVHMYNRSLSADDIQQAAAKLPTTDGLVGSWSLGQASEGVIEDASGNVRCVVSLPLTPVSVGNCWLHLPRCRSTRSIRPRSDLAPCFAHHPRSGKPSFVSVNGDG